MTIDRKRVSRDEAAITNRPLHRAAGTGATYLGPGDLYRFLVTDAGTRHRSLRTAGAVSGAVG